jgi:hypothetical protein
MTTGHDALTLLCFVYTGSAVSRVSYREPWASCRDECTEKPAGPCEAPPVCEADIRLPFAPAGLCFSRCKGRRARLSGLCKRPEQSAGGLSAADRVPG